MAQSVKDFQTRLASRLRRVFGDDVPVLTEWSSTREIAGIYVPRIDVAVGPFSRAIGGNCVEEYDRLCDAHAGPLASLIASHCENTRQLRHTTDARLREWNRPTEAQLRASNQNARCFIAIEIENSVSRKHLLGGAVNCSALGRVGVLVGWNDKSLRAMVRLQAYWEFLGNVGKNTFRTPNLLVVTPPQLKRAFTNAQVAVR